MRRTRRWRYGRVRCGVLRMTRWVLYGCHSDDDEELGKRRVEKRDHSETRPRMVESGCGCIPLAMARGAECRGEERKANGLKVGGWKQENERKCEWWSKGIGSTKDEVRVRGACKLALARRGARQGAKEGAGAKCASQEMAFGEEDGVVGWVRGFAQVDHLHRGEPRWTLDGMPLKQRETVCDRNGNNSIRCTTRHCDPSHTAVTNNLCWKLFHLHRQANRWAAPKSHRSKSCSPAYLTVSRSSTHSSPATTGGRIVIEMLLQG